jgi:hypothetical protein
MGTLHIHSWPDLIHERIYPLVHTIGNYGKLAIFYSVDNMYNIYTKGRGFFYTNYSYMTVFVRNGAYLTH